MMQWILLAALTPGGTVIPCGIPRYLIFCRQKRILAAVLFVFLGIFQIPCTLSCERVKDAVHDGHVVLPGRVGGSPAARRLAIVFRAAPTQDAATTVSQASSTAAASTPDVSQVAQTQAAAATVFEAAPTQDAAATVSRASTTTTTSRK